MLPVLDKTAPAPSAASGSASGARRDVQGLRALAVIAVILDHLVGWPLGGFAGVDVFFVISGYLITGLLLREYDRTGTISYRGFYARRIKRIIPAAVLVLAATVAAASVLTPGARFQRTLWDSVWALLFSSNWNLALQGTDYFAQGQLPSPIQHYWSLAVEEQFYLVWPWLLLGLLLLVVRRFRLGPRAGRLAIGLPLIALTVASFVYALQLTASDPNLAYFSSLTRAWELGVGALGAIFGPVLSPRGPVVRAVLGWLGFVGIVVSLFVTDPARGFPAPGAALPVLFTALVLLAGERGPQPSLWPLTNPVSRYIGDISYSLYLWHFPVIVLLLALLPSGTPAYFGAAATAMAGLSIIGYHAVENPIRRSGWLVGAGKAPSGAGRLRLTRPRRSRLRPGDAALAVMLLVTVAGVVLAMQHVAPRSAATDGGPVVAVAGPTTSTVASLRSRCLGAPALAAASCAKVDLGDALVPTAADAAGDTAQQEDCFIEARSAIESCRFGSTDTKALRVAVAGDSHAGNLLPGILSQAQKRQWAISTFVGDSCLLSAKRYAKCSGAQEEIIQRLTTPGAFDLVITTADRDKDSSPAQFAEVFRRVLSAGARLVVVGDVPSVTQDALLCYSRLGFDPRTSSCSTARSTAMQPVDPLPAAVKEAPGAEFVDPLPYLCTAKSCPSVIGNVIVYRDNLAHLTSTYSRTLGPYLVKRIAERPKARP